MARLDPLARLLARSVEAGDCWVYTGAHSAGYGQFWLDGRQWFAHRASYVLHGHDIPHGLQLDHLCRNRSCVNPAHLEPVSNRENQRRAGMPVARFQAGKTHCTRGHAYDASNTYVTSTGSRHCRTCTRENQRRYRKQVAS